MDDNGVLTFVILIVACACLVFGILIGRSSKKETIVNKIKYIEKIKIEIDTIEVQKIDTTEVIAVDTQFVYLNVPNVHIKKFGRYMALRDIKNERDYGQEFFTRDANQRFWNFCKTIFNQEFRAYSIDGVIYEWAPVTINSNTICISNTGSFEFNDEQELEHYVKSR